MLLPWVVLFPGILSLIFPIFLSKHPQLSTTELFLVTFIYLELGFLVKTLALIEHMREYLEVLSKRTKS